jgi:hypothetical protein
LRNRYHSNTLGFDPKIESIKSKTTISGYFQTWKYFAEFQVQIREEIEVVEKSLWYLEWQNKAKKEKIVMLHIRLGDYLEKQNEMFGSLSPNYYERALKLLPDELSQSPIWVFSDDIDAARSILSNIRDFNFEWIRPPSSSSPVESLLLMSSGAANIIANSTYSWWGAMLNNCQPVVIAPSKWFKSFEDPTDLIPENWLQIEPSWR